MDICEVIIVEALDSAMLGPSCSPRLWHHILQSHLLQLLLALLGPLHILFLRLSVVTKFDHLILQAKEFYKAENVLEESKECKHDHAHGKVLTNDSFEQHEYAQSVPHQANPFKSLLLALQKILLKELIRILTICNTGTVSNSKLLFQELDHGKSFLSFENRLRKVDEVFEKGKPISECLGSNTHDTTASCR